MSAPRNMPDMNHRFGAFADAGPFGDEGLPGAYFKTSIEAEAYARGLWAAMDEDTRRRTDVYAGEINLHEATHGPLAGRLVWDTVTITYDAKDEARRAILAELEDGEAEA